jgi:hypothetical protein
VNRTEQNRIRAEQNRKERVILSKNNNGNKKWELGTINNEGTIGDHLDIVPISELKPHPRNYRIHPQDQIEHLIQSITEYGIYRNIVIAQDGTILAGHGVCEAVKQMGLDEIPVVRLGIESDSPQALKLLAGDNEIENLGEIDDRALSEILKDIHDSDATELLGTGFDEQMLANLVFVTRPQSEIKDFNEAAEWVGMPEYEPSTAPIKLVISFENEQARQELATKLGYILSDKTKSVWYPPQSHDDVQSVRFVSDDN